MPEGFPLLPSFSKSKYMSQKVVYEEHIEVNNPLFSRLLFFSPPFFVLFLRGFLDFCLGFFGGLLLLFGFFGFLFCNRNLTNPMQAFLRLPVPHAIFQLSYPKLKIYCKFLSPNVASAVLPTGRVS